MSASTAPTLDWTFRRTGISTWTAGEYSIESTGQNSLSTKTGAANSRRGGGYAVYRGRQGLGRFGSVADAKARAERDAATR